MAYSDLTAEQKGVLSEYVRQQRALVGEFARWLNRVEAADNMYDRQAAAVLANVANGDLIADGSGLAGVSTLSKAEVASIAGAFQTILAQYQTDALRQLYVRMAGMTNTIG
jgi:hypothetical protein